MLPSTDPVARKSTLSTAFTLPFTLPLIVTVLASRSARILAVLADGEAVAAELDRALDVAVDGEIFFADDFAFDADGLADPCDDATFGVADFVGHVMTPPGHSPAKAGHYVTMRSFAIALVRLYRRCCRPAPERRRAAGIPIRKSPSASVRPSFSRAARRGATLRSPIPSAASRTSRCSITIARSWISERPSASIRRSPGHSPIAARCTERSRTSTRPSPTSRAC